MKMQVRKYEIRDFKMDEIIETAKREGNLHWFVSIMTQMKVKRDVSNISDVVILIQWTNEFSTTLLGGNTCKNLIITTKMNTKIK